jgi:hypothetical protein
LLLAPATVLAQGTGWEIEVHAGGALTDAPSSGTTTIPAPGAPFTTVTELPIRRVSSWFLGDGSVLLNDALVEFGSSGTITALDPVFDNALAERQDGGSVGFRVSREITPRFSAEFNLDFASAPLEITAPAVAAIQATRASFESAFEALFDTGPFADVAVSSREVAGCTAPPTTTCGSRS